MQRLNASRQSHNLLFWFNAIKALIYTVFGNLVSLHDSVSELNNNPGISKTGGFNPNALPFLQEDTHKQEPKTLCRQLVRSLIDDDSTIRISIAVNSCSSLY